MQPHTTHTTTSPPTPAMTSYSSCCQCVVLYLRTQPEPLISWESRRSTTLGPNSADQCLSSTFPNAYPFPLPLLGLSHCLSSTSPTACPRPFTLPFIRLSHCLSSAFHCPSLCRRRSETLIPVYSHPPPAPAHCLSSAPFPSGAGRRRAGAHHRDQSRRQQLRSVPSRRTQRQWSGRLKVTAVQ